MAAKAMAEQSSFAGFSPGVLGEAISSEGGFLVPHEFSSVLLNAKRGAFFQMQSQVVHRHGEQSIEAQMADDDLFELNCPDDGTHDEQSLLLA